MRQANIVIMGKTGTGKSTLVNAVMEADVAPTGLGRPVTLKNEIYTNTISLRKNTSRKLTYKLNLYDTVGLEINSSITNKTLSDIKKQIKESQKDSSDYDANLVWFCVSSRLSRFEPYEIDLINKLIYDYEIPFIIVITQCFSDEKSELEKQIRADLPEINVIRVLAQDYKTRMGIFPSFGIMELLNSSVFDCDKFKVKLLKSKLDKLNDELFISKDKIDKMERHGKAIINEFTDKATKIGWIPTLCIPFVHGLCIKMVTKLTEAFDIHTTDGFGEEIFCNVIIGVICSPLMAVPILSAGVAYAYVETAGEQYMEVLKNVVVHSTIHDIHNKELMSERIKQELLNRS